VRRLLPALVLLICACRGGRSTLVVTVESSAVVRGVDHLMVGVSSSAKTVTPFDVAIPNAPADIPPSHSLTLVLDEHWKGLVTVAVDAVNVAGTTLSSASVTAKVAPGKSTRVTVTLPGSATSYSAIGFASGLGGGVSSDGSFAVEGVIAAPGARVTSQGGGFTVESLVPGSGP